MNPLIGDYLVGPRALREVVSDMTREQLLARPIPDKWSTLEVICHLSDFEPILADRMKRIITHDKPQLLGADENLFAKGLAYHERDLEEELRLIELTRSQMGRILNALPAEILQRTGVHSERGELSLERILQLAVRHIPHHLTFIIEKRKALGLSVPS